MKNKFYYIALSLVVILTSCDYLNVPFDNRARIDTEEKIGMLMVSAYASSSEWIIAEFSSDNVDHNLGLDFNMRTATEEEAFRWEQVTGVGQDTPHNFWNAAYSAIANANLALESIERLAEQTGLTPALRAFRAEALMSRAYHHFRLANIFCMPFGNDAANQLGLPFMDHVENTVAPHYERGTLAELYARIQNDIEAALPHIVNDHLTVQLYRFNRMAAHAFAARFFLHTRDYERSIRYANVVLGTNPAGVLRDWRYGGELLMQDDFRPNWFVNADNPANLLNSVVSSFHATIITSSFWSTRFSHNHRIANSESSRAATPWGTWATHHFPALGFGADIPKVITPKYTMYMRITDPIAQIGFPHIIQVHFSTDETLLSRAEALIMLGRYQEAVDDMNTFMMNYSATRTEPPFEVVRVQTLDEIADFYRTMPRYTPFAPTPRKPLMNPDLAIQEGSVREGLLHAVLHLRRILTVHEGLRWQDVRRFGIEIYRREVQGMAVVSTTDFLSFDDPRRAIQIPEAVAAAGMEMNPR